MQEFLKNSDKFINNDWIEFKSKDNFMAYKKEVEKTETKAIKVLFEVDLKHYEKVNCVVT
jgi:hypothetical protein